MGSCAVPRAAALDEILLYPVKSLGGVSVKAAYVEPWGLREDRRWLVLKRDGTVLTARRQHRMLLLTASPRDGGGIVLRAPDGSMFPVEVPDDGPTAPILLSRLDSARLASREANEWLSSELREDVRLAWLDDARRRSVSPAHGGHPGDALNLSDAGPLLLTSKASLEEVNTWVAAEAQESKAPVQNITMRRFRPNLVIGGTLTPFIEDGWRRIEVGDVAFRFGEHCDRCVMTTIDPETLATGKQPLRALARHHQWGHKTWFGIRLVPISVGRISVGAGVRASN